eukprot:CAMPEP_0119389062 /NCGR_PEP_ID=MMETSP1334-20130426/107597_1 /TAXON_ID=127549 /ORGANISM="Calcidiscus leptoporus, Strain RCC1130" /LENGTH=129 /DNA_ID=CAMNT_0007411201 /DNA_START=103 /DNA_END=488 /DNA_ORIENTATION=+
MPPSTCVFGEQHVAWPKATLLAAANCGFNVAIQSGYELAPGCRMPFVVVRARCPTQPHAITRQTISHSTDLTASCEWEGDGVPVRIGAIVIQPYHRPLRGWCPLRRRVVHAAVASAETNLARQGAQWSA